MSHVIDSPMLKRNWSVPELEKVFSDEARLQYWLDVEAALAKVQGELGVIPKDAAEEIVANCKFDKLDKQLFDETFTQTGHMIMPLLKCVETACSGTNGQFVHFGATTQDIIDTGMVLQMRAATNYIMGQAIRLEKAILVQAEKYKNLPMAGRTHGQQGLPITLGFKFATWATELRRDIERMKEFPQRVFILMLHGAVGTMAGFGEKAFETVEGVANELKLKNPPICWASSRDTVAEYLATLGILAGTLGRIANEILASSTSEVGELREPMGRNTVGSSTMPHKRNANVAEMSVSQCRIVASNAMLGMIAQVCQHERDARIWRMDFHNVPESSVIVGRMLFALANVVEGIEVDEKNINRNLNLLGGLLLSEAVMFALGEKMGKQKAHHLLRELTLAQKDDLTFIQRLHANPEVKAVMTDEEIDAIFDYSKYLGMAPQIVDQVAAYCHEMAKTDPKSLQ